MALKSNDKIYFDADCLSAFFKTNHESILLLLYGEKIVIPTIVEAELRVYYPFQMKLDNWKMRKVYKSENIDFGTATFELYCKLTTGLDNMPKIDKGEAAVIALSYANSKNMSSNNLKDVSYYIKEFNLNNKTIAKILLEATNESIITIDEANKIWQEMSNKMIYLPRKYGTFSDWLEAGAK